MHENGNCLAPKIKLPTIEIPKFGGQITEFKHFYDTFNSLIINNQAMDDVKKFHYLLSSVTNEAHQLIQNVPVTQQNFCVAWNLLCDRNNNERLIAAARPVFTHGPPVPGPRAANFQGRHIKKISIEVWYAGKKGCP